MHLIIVLLNIHSTIDIAIKACKHAVDTQCDESGHVSTQTVQSVIRYVENRPSQALCGFRLQSQ